ncbi:MAG: hypothetical protein U0167_19885 [bacterium]
MTLLRCVGLAGVLTLSAPAPPTPPVPAAPVGGQLFLCGMFQAVKYVSLFTGNVEGVVVGAIGSGLSCGFGW